MKQWLMIGLAAALLSISVIRFASAHAELDSSDPAAGANLTTAPTKVTLVFSEEISATETDSFFTVTNEQGATVGTGKLDNTDVNHQTMSATLNAGLGDGIYTVKWQATTSDDNGKTEGSFTFGVNKAPGAQATAAPEAIAAPEATATPTAAPATAPTSTAAQPTATSAPSTLPKTAGDQADLSGYILLGALLLLGGGLALLRFKRRA